RRAPGSPSPDLPSCAAGGASPPPPRSPPVHRWWSPPLPGRPCPTSTGPPTTRCPRPTSTGRPRCPSPSSTLEVRDGVDLVALRPAGGLPEGGARHLCVRPVDRGQHRAGGHRVGVGEHHRPDRDVAAVLFG